MKKFFLLMAGLTLIPLKAVFANPACPVCTVAIGASLGVARKFGVADTIVGLWAGAMLVILGYWLIRWFDKKGWKFAGRDFIILALSVGMVGFMYISELVYTPQPIFFFYMDPFLFSSLLGALTFVYSQKFYQWMKAKNGGRAHFPFEKVALPMALLAGETALLHYFPL